MFFQQNAFEAKDSAHSISGLCTLGEPVVGAVAVDFNGGGNGQGVVGADFFDKTAVAGRTAVGDDDVLKRSAFASFALQTEFDCHVLKFENFSEKKPARLLVGDNAGLFEGANVRTSFPKNQTSFVFTRSKRDFARKKFCL